MGFDFDRGVVAISTHPFCNGISSPSDVRITTRYHENDIRPALFGLIHEGGHALYEQGFDSEWEGTPASEAKSLSLHESQSRLWENKVARSAPFWRHYYEPLCAHYPDVLGDVSREDFVRAITVVEPSLIRVEADEVTYNLHIALRVEIEQALISGDLAVKDVSGAWDDRMEALLGVRPTNAADGVLQDIHWSFGAFGYFSTYFMGNLYAAQFFAQAKESISGLEDQIARGELRPLRSWLGENIHQLGCLYSAEEVCEKVTGRTLESRHYLDYLCAKLEDIHG